MAFHQSHFPGVRGWGGAKIESGAGDRGLEMEALGPEVRVVGAEVGAIWGYRARGRGKRRSYFVFFNLSKYLTFYS